MVTDYEKKLQEEGVEKLLVARQQQSSTDKAGGHRKFQVPTLNWEEKEYPQIIFWGTTKVSESPVTATLEDSDIDIIQPLDLPSFLCHSKTVERAVKLVTEASHTVYG